MMIISKEGEFVKDRKVISKQTYLDYVAWMTQSNYPNRMILTEREWNCQMRELFPADYERSECAKRERLEGASSK